MPQQPKGLQQTLPEWIPSALGIVETYSNLTVMQWSLDDVRIRFAQLVNDPKRPTPGPVFFAKAEERAAITLSWRNAKVLRDQLDRLIQSYEAANGAISTTAKKLAFPEGAASPEIVPTPS